MLLKLIEAGQSHKFYYKWQKMSLKKEKAKLTVFQLKKSEKRISSKREKLEVYIF